jgi:hypothetical protein
MRFVNQCLFTCYVLIHSFRLIIQDFHKRSEHFIYTDFPKVFTSFVKTLYNSEVKNRPKIAPMFSACAVHAGAFATCVAFLH